MSPLGFEPPRRMFDFLAVRFKGTTASVQEQTLSWLQVRDVANILIRSSLKSMPFQRILFHMSRSRGYCFIRVCPLDVLSEECLP